MSLQPGGNVFSSIVSLGIIAEQTSAQAGIFSDIYVAQQADGEPLTNGWFVIAGSGEGGRGFADALPNLINDHWYRFSTQFSYAANGNNFAITLDDYGLTGDTLIQPLVNASHTLTQFVLQDTSVYPVFGLSLVRSAGAVAIDDFQVVRRAAAASSSQVCLRCFDCVVGLVLCEEKERDYQGVRPISRRLRMMGAYGRANN